MATGSVDVAPSPNSQAYVSASLSGSEDSDPSNVQSSSTHSGVNAAVGARLGGCSGPRVIRTQST